MSTRDEHPSLDQQPPRDGHSPSGERMARDEHPPRDEHHRPGLVLIAHHDLLPTSLYTFDKSTVIDWRMRTRMRTVSVALIMCLNIGVEPPDQYRPPPVAQLQCWIDPSSLPPAKALAMIGARLQQQYERWQPRARYVTSLDQTVDDLRKLCISLRRSSKGERILFHYNGHGVPRPTDNGEIWLFNKNYTQYVPLSVYELASWLQSPTIYVFDCNNAGMIPSAFASYEQQRSDPESPHNDTIILAACSAGEYIPMNPDFGVADVFTSCLTTPIQVALRWFLFTTPPFLRQIRFDQIDQIPGKPNDRKTPIGELNWIFTAVTDTIAWSSLPCALFQRLFRQDLLVASQYRNYLLACRLMQGFGCHPISQPALPDTSQHAMWQQWDLIADWACTQTRRYLQDPERFVFQTSSFFTDQLTAFEIWLDLGSESKRPLQLPVVLQVLLSQTHRLRALELLAKFVDMGPWAVNQALSVGIFPYILKLLQSPTHELRHVLVFIWSKIIALDPSCQRELIKDQYHMYFISVASSQSASSFQRSLAIFVLAAIADGYPAGQLAVVSANVFTLLVSVLSGSDVSSVFLRHMTLMCLANIWRGNSHGRQLALSYHDSLKTTPLDLVLEIALHDTHPLARASAIHAITTFLTGPHSSSSSSPDNHNASFNLDMVKALFSLQEDVSVLVRQHLLYCIAALFCGQRDEVVLALNGTDQLHSDFLIIYTVIKKSLNDPATVVANLAQRIDKLVTAASDPATNVASEGNQQAEEVWESNLFQFTRDLIRRRSDQRQDSSPDCQTTSYLSCPLSQFGSTTRLHLYDRIDAAAMKIEQAGELNHCLAMLSSPLDYTMAISLHPYEPVVIGSDRDHICLLNYRDMRPGSIFDNGNQQGSEITSIGVISPKHTSLLFSASSDGAIRIWYGMLQNELSLRSAFVAYQTMSASLNDRLYTEWQEDHRRLISGSTWNPVKIWDMNLQICVGEVQGVDQHYLKSMCTDQDQMLITAHSDRNIRIADLRLLGQSQIDVVCSHEDDIVGVYSKHSTPSPVLVSCSDRGSVHINDLRMPSRLLLRFQGSSSSFRSDRWTSCAVSQYGNLYAAVSVKQLVHIGTLSGTALNTLRQNEGFLGQRLGAAQCIAFHERCPVLAVASHDHHIGLFTESNTDRYWEPV